MRGDGGGDGRKWWQDFYHESLEGKGIGKLRDFRRNLSWKVM